MKNFALRMKELRTAAGFSQDTAAKKLNISLQKAQDYMDKFAQQTV